MGRRRTLVCDTRNGMYKRIVLKLSGEALAGERGFGLDANKVAEITRELAEIHDLGIEIGLVRQQQLRHGRVVRNSCQP